MTLRLSTIRYYVTKIKKSSGPVQMDVIKELFSTNTWRMIVLFLVPSIIGATTGFLAGALLSGAVLGAIGIFLGVSFTAYILGRILRKIFPSLRTEQFKCACILYLFVMGAAGVGMGPAGILIFWPASLAIVYIVQRQFFNLA